MFDLAAWQPRLLPYVTSTASHVVLVCADQRRREREDGHRRKREHIGMEGLSAVLSRFPAKAQAIRQLALADEAFRSLCADFAVAEAVLQQLDRSTPPTLDRSTPPTNDKRRLEYKALVSDLLAEIDEQLSAREPRLEPSGPNT